MTRTLAISLAIGKQISLMLAASIVLVTIAEIANLAAMMIDRREG